MVQTWCCTKVDHCLVHVFRTFTNSIALLAPKGKPFGPLLRQADPARPGRGWDNFRVADHPGVGMNFVYNVALASAKATLARCIADEIAMTLT